METGNITYAESTPGESGAAAPSMLPPALRLPAAAVTHSRVNPSCRAESPRQPATPSLDRLLAYVRTCIGAGAGWPNNTVICRAMHWRHVSSVKLALYKLERRGDIRRAGTTGRGWGRRMLWELTVQGIERRLTCRPS